MSNTPKPTFIDIETAAHSGAFGANAMREPTDSQCEAGNYKMGRFNFNGMPIVIEQPRGSYRTGINNKTGKRWMSRMSAHYGYIGGTRGADGDAVDCFFGYYPESEIAFVVNQHVGGRFDEHKMMLAFPDMEAAKSAYMGSFDRGWNGLESIIQLSISQLKWWLKNGNNNKPLNKEDLPKEGLESMKRVYWNKDAMPEGKTLDQLLYEIRKADSGENLLLDSISINDILEDSDGVLALDALVVTYARLERKMELLQGIMERTGKDIKPVAMQISEPFKQNGVANVAVSYELSDGQTISIYLHNPDTTPQKMAPTDEVISWKWMLNKKDITIVVAPERGNDLNVREVARRILKLAEKNSAGFARANVKRAERMQNIQNLKDEIVELEKELKEVQEELEIAKMEAVDRVGKETELFIGVRESLSKMGWKGFEEGDAMTINEYRASGNNGTSGFKVERLDRESGVWGDVGIVKNDPGKTSEQIADEIVSLASPDAGIKDIDAKTPEQLAADIDASLPETTPTDQKEPVVVLSGKELGDFPDTPDGLKALRGAARTYLESKRGKWVKCPAMPNDENGNVREVELRQRGIDEFIRYSAKSEKLKLAAKIEEIIETAFNAETETNFKPEKKPSSIAYYRLKNRVAIDGEAHDVTVLIEQDLQGYLHYDFILPDTKAKAALDSSAALQSEAIPATEAGVPDTNKSATLDAAGQESGGRMVINLFIDGEEPEVIEDYSESTEITAAKDFLQSVADGTSNASDLMKLLDEIDASAQALIDAGLGSEYDELIGSAAEKWAELDQQANG
ncbi:hypothetical protein SAMN05216302_104612 [Nitrosomonas aestuarii]|uniref:Defence against restriction A N-terminal domain-containing protein n=1 Tax=Nitrosomonas aestuarii TaxID=52441 RepID=A0A1I4G2G9_9PROT|nr:hypothetical protein [Nitrosomonas aestuarii]SFL23949.1 hypothetical protein SAMN05216302_104612 [Nitrosomonas aestuarii]